MYIRIRNHSQITARVWWGIMKCSRLIRNAPVTQVCTRLKWNRKPDVRTWIDRGLGMVDGRGNNLEKGIRKYSQLVGFPRRLHTPRRDVLTRVCMRGLPGLDYAAKKRRERGYHKTRRGRRSQRQTHYRREEDENRPWESAATCAMRVGDVERGRGWKLAAALSPRTEIDFLSIHSTAQMSSFDNCCVIECTEYWRVRSPAANISLSDVVAEKFLAQTVLQDTHTYTILWQFFLLPQ